jgi:hypothetical protein
MVDVLSIQEKYRAFFMGSMCGRWSTLCWRYPSLGGSLALVGAQLWRKPHSGGAKKTKN